MHSFKNWLGKPKWRKEALTLEYSRRPESRINDERRKNQKTLPINQNNIHRWSNNPNKYDLYGIDTPNHKIPRKDMTHYVGTGRIESHYRKSDVIKARNYLKQKKTHYSGRGSSFGLQSEVARMFNSNRDPELIDFSSLISGDAKVSEGLNSERKHAMAEFRSGF